MKRRKGGRKEERKKEGKEGERRKGGGKEGRVGRKRFAGFLNFQISRGLL